MVRMGERGRQKNCEMPTNTSALSNICTYFVNERREEAREARDSRVRPDIIFHGRFIVWTGARPILLDSNYNSNRPPAHSATHIF